MKKTNSLLFICMFFLSTLSLIATTILLEESEVIVKKSDLIVEAYVKNIEYHTISQSSSGYVFVTLGIVEYIKGKGPSEIVIHRVGLSDKGEFLCTNYDPAYKVGEKMVICLQQDMKGRYWVRGFYRGKYIINNDIIDGTKYKVSEFKTIIREILEGSRSKFPDELKKQVFIENSSHNPKLNSVLSTKPDNKIMHSGTHLGGGFVTFNESWNPSTTSITFYYNPNNAPGEGSENIVRARISEAMNNWNSVSQCMLKFQLSSSSTSEEQINNQTCVIHWINQNPGVLAHEWPNPPGYDCGFGNKTGSDIWFNYNISISKPPQDSCPVWDFSSSPSPRSGDYFDFVDVLNHELGHTFGLNENYNDQYQTMWGSYGGKLVPVRALGNGDKAGAIYMNPVSDWSGSMPFSIVLSACTQSFNITGNLTIPSGKVFEIESGKTLRFSSGTSLIVNGTLSASGNSYSDCVNFTNSSGTWGGIKLYSSNVNMSYCKITNADKGIYIQFVSPSIQWTWINNCNFGIFLNGGGVNLNYNTLAYNSTDGIYAFGSGLISLNGSNGHNVISYNHDGILAQYYSTVNASNGSNSILNNHQSGCYEAANDGSSTISASYTYWGMYQPPSSWFYGNVDYTNSLESNPNPGRPLLKQVTAPVTSNNNIFQKVNQNNTTGDDELNQAYQLWQSKQYNITIEKCKSILSKDPIKAIAYPALSLIRLAAQEIKESDIETYLENIALVHEKDETGGVALLNHSYYLLFKEQYTSALSMLDLAERRYENTNIEKVAMFQKILTLFNHLKDNKTGEEELAKFESKYKDDNLIKALRGLIDRPDLPEFNKKQPQQNTTSINIVNNDLLSNYPNPFNPSTIIDYSVPIDGKVKIVIFDAIGKEVKTLVDEWKAIGKYSVKFNANSLSSGIYFCRILISPSNGGKDIIQQKMMQLLR